MAGSDKTSIGDRFKDYEAVTRYYLPYRVPLILRVDGRSFHSVTRKSFGKKWAREFTDIMIETSKNVQKEIDGCSIAYCQSDEISFLITNYKTISTEGWFKYNLSKMVSISASIASVTFSMLYGKPVSFDSRVFSVPQDDITNYFIWRQQDSTRNAIQMAGREYYSHKELNNKNCNMIQEMLFQKGLNFNDYPIIRKRGFCIVNEELDENIPVFSKDREYIEQHIYIRED
jgi:tRNA(His) 5'-end guanylyltransferase